MPIMKKRIILVTGGNRGIGLATVNGLAAKSDDTILLGSRDATQTNLELSKLPSNVTIIKLDLQNEITIQNDLELILSKYPRIDVLINNAGILIEKNWTNLSHEDLLNSMQVHFMAPFQLIKKILPEMIKNNYGRIINVSSGWGSFEDKLTGPLAYSVSKAALNALTLNLSHDLPNNVKINSMCPGWVQTRMGGPEAPRNPTKGAETILWLSNLDNDGPSGKFFRDMKLIKF